MMGRIAKRAALDAKREEEVREDTLGSNSSEVVGTDAFSEKVRALRRHR
jgi:hypothetical protein